MAIKKKEQITLDYKTLSMQDMVDYISEYHNDKESKDAFKKVALKQQVKQTTIPATDENGNIITYIDKKGRTRKKLKRVDVKDGKVTTVISIFDAKSYFYETYKDEIEFTNAPKHEKKVDMKALLLNW